MTNNVKTKFYLYNCGNDNCIAVNWRDFWVILNPGNAKFDGVTIDSPEFCKKYAEIIHKYPTSFYEIVLDNNINPNCFCCYDPERNYVLDSELIQLIAEVEDDTKVEDIKEFRWYDSHCEVIVEFTE